MSSDFLLKEKQYLVKKRQNIINIINKYNTSGLGKYDLDEKNFDIEKEFCSENRCANCKYCCHQFPCVFSPGDFLDITDMDYMLNILKTGLVCIARSENKRVFLIRPRGYTRIDHEVIGIGIGDPIPHMTKFSCLFMYGGCMLPAVYHPSEAILHFLKSSKEYDGYCRHWTIYSPAMYEAEWEKYQGEMEELLRLYCKEFTEEQISKALENESDRSKILINALIDYHI